MARHSQGAVTSHMISYTNRHISAAKMKLQFGILSILTTVLVYRLAGVQGKVAADGSKFEIYENNLHSSITSATEVMVVSPITMSLTNILLFTHFITCGVGGCLYFGWAVEKSLRYSTGYFAQILKVNLDLCLLFPIFLVSN